MFRSRSVPRCLEEVLALDAVDTLVLIPRKLRLFGSGVLSVKRLGACFVGSR